MTRAVSVLGFVLVLSACGGKRERESPLLAAAKACHGDLSCAVPIFNVRDLRASQRYYRDSLGFKVEWESGNPPDFGAVKRGDTSLFMCQGCQGGGGAWIMTFTDDVDKLHRELVARKAIIRMPPTDMPWKIREMHVADPDGNVIRIGSEIDH